MRKINLRQHRLALREVHPRQRQPHHHEREAFPPPASAKGFAQSTPIKTRRGFSTAHSNVTNYGLDTKAIIVLSFSVTLDDRPRLSSPLSLPPHVSSCLAPQRSLSPAFSNRLHTLRHKLNGIISLQKQGEGEWIRLISRVSKMLRTEPENPASAIRGCRLRQPQLRQRQLAHPLPGRGKNRVAQRWRERRHPRLADSCRRCFAFYQVNMRLARRRIHSRHRVAVEIGLLDHSILRGDFSVERQARRESRRSLELVARSTAGRSRRAG